MAGNIPIAVKKLKDIRKNVFSKLINPAINVFTKNNVWFPNNI